MKDHAVGVLWQAFAAKQQVFLFYKRHGVLAQQAHGLARADVGDGGRDLVGVDVVRLMARQAQQHGCVGAVAHARGRQRTEELNRHVVHCGQAQRAAHMAGKLPRRNHGAHGVRAGRADADLEKVENADGHGGGLTGDKPGSKESRLPEGLGAQRRAADLGACRGRQGGAVRYGRKPSAQHIQRHARYPCLGLGRAADGAGCVRASVLNR